MKLYGGRLSPYFERVILQLEFKGRRDAVETPGVPGGMGSEAFHKISPIGKIPCLELDNGKVFPESQVICHYFEATFPEPSLIPTEPARRAQTELLCRLADLYVGAALPPLFRLSSARQTKGADAEAAVAGMTRALGQLEHFLQPGERAVGDDWSLADCALIPMMFYVQLMGGLFGYQAFDGRPKLESWNGAVAKTGLVKKSNAAMNRAVQEFIGQKNAG